MRLPLGQDRLCLCQALRSSNDEEAVIQREFDEVYDQPAIMEHQCAARLVTIGLGRDSQDGDRRLAQSCYAPRCRAWSRRPGRLPSG